MQFQGKLINHTWENGKNLFLGPIFTFVAQIWATNFFSWILPLLHVKNSRKTNEPNLSKYNLSLFCKKNLASSVTRYHGQLSSCTIPEKTNDPILRKFSDRRERFYGTLSDWRQASNKMYICWYFLEFKLILESYH